MDQTNDVHQKRRLSAKAIVAVVASAIVIAVMCFAVIAMLPASDRPFFDSPLRSALTGVGLLGVAAPLCIGGYLLKRHSAGSPYFEEGFMAGVLNVFGFIVLAVAVACLALAAYALIVRSLGAR
jgi:hypothetical protein